jgi:hypothetical protein
MAAPLFDAARAAWLQSGTVSVIAASRGASPWPVLALSFGCRISDDRRAITLFIGATAGADLIAAVQAGAPLAVIFTESSTTRSLQFKATESAIVPLEPGDRERMRAYVGAIAQHWVQIGQPIDWTRTLLDPDADTPVAVQLTPYVAFDQTPGPQAGIVMPVPT